MNLINRDKLIPHCSCDEECMADREKCKKCCDYVVNFEDIQEEPIVNAIEIPNKATNGDVMKATLPIDWESKFFGTEDKGIQIRKDYVFIHLKNDVGSVHFTKEWWDAPYEEV